VTNGEPVPSRALRTPALAIVHLSLACLALMMFVMAPAWSQRISVTDFKVDLARLYDKHKHTKDVSTVCKNGIWHSSSYRDAFRLNCAVALLCQDWTGAPQSEGDGKALRCKQREGGTTPTIVCGKRETARPADPESCEALLAQDNGKGSVKQDWWVIRQSPHADSNIKVLPGAKIWLEVAYRPRLKMVDLKTIPNMEANCGETPSRTITLNELFDVRCHVVQADVAAIEGIIERKRKEPRYETLISSTTPQLPIAGLTLEPWQDVYLFEPPATAPPIEVPKTPPQPPRPPIRTEDPVPPEVKGALAGAVVTVVMGYALRRRRPQPQPTPTTAASAGPAKGKPPLRIRVDGTE
jgi:hypothetical protein